MENRGGYDLLIRLHQQAVQSISQAVSLEERGGEISQAIFHYENGLKVVNSAFSLTFTAYEWEKANAVITKMKELQQRATERLLILRNKRGITTPELPPKTTSPANIVTGVGGLWAENLTDSGKRNTLDSRQQAIDSNRNRAENLLQQVESVPGSGQANKHLGLPTNGAELADLLIESALLPKPHMTSIQNSSGANNSRQPVIGEKLQQFSQQNPQLAQGLFQMFMNSALQSIQNPAQQDLSTLTPQQRKHQFFVNALAQEPQQKWNRIHWCSSASEAAQKARISGKPIFIEIVVGRLADKSSDVC